MGCVIFDEYLFSPGGHPGLTECLGGAAGACSVAAAEDVMSLVEGLVDDALADDAAGRMAIARICIMEAERGIGEREKEASSGGGGERKEGETQLKLGLSEAFDREALFLSSLP